MCRYEISDQQWLNIVSFLSGKVGDVSRSANDNRLFINTMLWITRNEIPWRGLSESFRSLELSLSLVPAVGKGEHLENVFEALQEPDLID